MCITFPKSKVCDFRIHIYPNFGQNPKTSEQLFCRHSDTFWILPKMFPGFPKVAECSNAKHQILAPSCQDHAYLGEITKTRSCETLTYDLGLNETFCTVHRTFLHGNWIQFLMLIVTEQVVRNYGLRMWSSPVCMWLTFSICRHLRHG